MGKISRVMVIGWLTLAAGILAMPQFIALIPESALPWVVCVAGALTVAVRWLNGALGVNPLSLVGVCTFIAGVLSLPELGSIIPLAWSPFMTVIVSVLTLISRYMAGQTKTDPAKTVNVLFRTS